MLDYEKLRAALQTAFIAGLSGCLMNPAALAQSSNETLKPPVFDAATIKPAAPYGNAGLYAYPGGRIIFGGYIKWLIEIAFDLQDYQLGGGPNWKFSRQEAEKESTIVEGNGCQAWFSGMTPERSRAGVLRF